MNRNSKLAANKRDAIFLILGRRCAKCGSKTEPLEFDVIVPVGDPKSHHQKMSWGQRMNFYCRQLSAGNLQVLCAKCNGAKGESDEQFWREKHGQLQGLLIPPGRTELETVPAAADCPF